MQNIFDARDAQNYISRINTLTPETQGKWGVMTVDQVLAHLNVAFEIAFEPHKFKKMGSIAKFIMKNFVKQKVVGEKSYPKNGPTSPLFKVSGAKNFDEERKKLIGYIQKTQQMGRESFDGKENHSFGKLTAQEWNNMFVKHLNHHLEQFGV